MSGADTRAPPTDLPSVYTKHRVAPPTNRKAHAMSNVLTAHTATDYQVWVTDAAGTPVYAYRTGLIYSAARNWAAAWNADRPADVAPGAMFVVVTATTTYTIR